MTIRNRLALPAGLIMAVLFLAMARPACAQIYDIAYDHATAARSGQNWIVTVTLINDGDQTPVNVEITNATLNGTSTTSNLPASVGGMPPGGTATTSLTFPLSAGAPGTTATISVSGSYTTDFGDTGGFGGGGSVNLPPLHVVSLTLNPSTLYGGDGSNGTVTLDYAPAANTAVSLSSSNPAVAAPVLPSVTVVAGQTSADFTVITSPVTSTANATITATLGSSSQSAQLTVVPPIVTSLSLSPSTVTGGASSTGSVFLSSPAPAGGMAVSLSSNSGYASVPPTVTVPSGYLGAAFTITTSPVPSTVTATISASGGGTTVTATLTIMPAPPLPVTSLTLSPTTVTGGTSSTATVTISAAAPTGGTSVALSSSDAAATVPSSVTVPAGSNNTTFTVTTNPVSSTDTVTISASSGGTTQQASLTILPAVLTSLALNPATVEGAQSSTGTISLNGPAPAGGATIVLSCSNSAAVNMPTSVTIPAGSTSTTFTLTANSVPAPTTVTIFAGYNGVTLQQSLTITPPVLTAISVSPSPVVGGATVTITVTLDSPAPNGGLAIAFISSNPTIFPGGTIVIPAGQTSGSITVTTTVVSSNTTVTLSASFNGNTVSCQLTVLTLAVANLTFNPNPVPGGTSSTATLTLNGSAPTGGVSVALSSSNAKVASVPSTVSVAAGESSATFTVKTTVVASDTNVTISATYNGATLPSVLTVQAPVLTSLTLNPASVKGEQTSAGTVTLSGPAPSGGLSVALSSNDASAAVPASVTVAAGKTSATFNITTQAVATTTQVTITATLNNVTQQAGLTVFPPNVQYTITDLGVLPGGSNSTPSDGHSLNQTGDVVGYSTALSEQAVIWLFSAKFGLPSGINSLEPQLPSIADGINDLCQVTGLANNGSYGQAFIWLPTPAFGLNAGLNFLGTLGAGMYSTGFGINNASQVVGWTGTPPYYHAILWLLAPAFGWNAGMYDLGTLAQDASDHNSSARSINNRGEIVGESDTDLVDANGNVILHAVAWTVNNGVVSITDLGTLPGDVDSQAFGNNDQGWVVGASESLSGLYRAMLYKNGKMQDLGILPGFQYSVADGVNSNGVIVGGAVTTDNQVIHAWVYSGQIMADLNDLIDPDSGWTLQQANSVNDSGKIAGSGIAPDGQVHAFLLTPIVEVASLTINPATVAGSLNATGTVTLNDPTPTNTVVTLTNANPAASMPASVTIAAGSTSKTFTIKTTAVTTTTTGTITATVAGLSVSNTLTVRPIGVSSVKLNPTSVIGGSTVSGAVKLEAKAAPEAITVVFSSSNPAVVPAPASIIISAGSQTDAFTVTTNAVAAKTAVTLSATANGITKTVKLIVTP